MVIAESSNYCVMCNEEIPEGFQVCRICQNKAEQGCIISRDYNKYNLFYKKLGNIFTKKHSITNV